METRPNWDHADNTGVRFFLAKKMGHINDYFQSSRTRPLLLYAGVAGVALLFLMATIVIRLANHGSDKFDHYVLAIQWPPGVCKTSKCSVDGNAMDYWTIHGLWPSNEVIRRSFAAINASKSCTLCIYDRLVDNYYYW